MSEATAWSCLKESSPARMTYIALFNANSCLFTYMSAILLLQIILELDGSNGAKH